MSAEDFETEAQETQVWSILWSWILVKILRLRFRQYLEAEFEAKVWSRFWLWSLVEILKMKFGRDFEAEILFVKLNFDHPVVWHKASTLVRALNPLCLWQCLQIMMKPNFKINKKDDPGLTSFLTSFLCKKLLQTRVEWKSFMILRSGPILVFSVFAQMSARWTTCLRILVKGRIFKQLYFRDNMLELDSVTVSLSISLYLIWQIGTIVRRAGLSNWNKLVKLGRCKPTPAEFDWYVDNLINWRDHQICP